MALTTGKKKRRQGLTPASGVRSPFWPINRLQNQFDQLFENCFDRCLEPTGAAFASCMPNVDVFEDKDKVVVKTEIPGMKKDELEVYLTGNFLNIFGEHKEEADNKSAATQKVERYFGRFHRCVSLPAEVDSNKIQAHYKAGVLTVKCPKTAGAKQKEIEIKID
jgi:HSP20 family protein